MLIEAGLMAVKDCLADLGIVADFEWLWRLVHIELAGLDGQVWPFIPSGGESLV